MKQMKRFIALILVLSFSLCVLTSCESTEQRVNNKVYTYLNEKYKGIEFEINGYKQDTETSGKYTFDVTCLTTGLDFEIIMSSLVTSDNYYVVHANQKLRNELFDMMGASRELICVDDIQCFDYYLSDSGTYLFNEDVEVTSYMATDLKELHRVKLVGVKDANDAAQCVYLFCDILKSKNVILDKVTFEFVLDDDKILFTTNTKTIEDTVNGTDSFSALEELFEMAETSVNFNNLFYKDPDSDAKVITYIHD